jgi:hypothetical protein
VSLTIQPVISADRRFVRLNFGNPFGGGAGGGGVTLTNLVPGIVNTLPVVVPVFSGSAIQDPTEQVVFTMSPSRMNTGVVRHGISFSLMSSLCHSRRKSLWV